MSPFTVRLFSFLLGCIVAFNSASGLHGPDDGLNADNIPLLRTGSRNLHHEGQHNKNKESKAANKDHLVDTKSIVPEWVYLFEAENETKIKHGQKGSTFRGYTGSGYVNIRNKMGGSVEFRNIVVNITGNYRLVFRYAVKDVLGRKSKVQLNGSTIGVLNFANTGKWSAWMTEKMEQEVHLEAGKQYRIRVVAHEKGPNLDCLQVVANPDIRKNSESSQHLI